MISLYCQLGEKLSSLASQVLFAVTSSFFVQTYAPFAFHTGIPEIKTILGGYIITGFLAPMVLLVKSLGLPLAVASGLSLGKVSQGEKYGVQSLTRQPHRKDRSCTSPAA